MSALQQPCHSLTTDVQDLKDVTSQVHYEKYRCEKLTALAAGKEVSHLPLHRF